MTNYHNYTMKDINNNLISTPKFRFKLESYESNDDLTYKPEKKYFSFYQICQFPIDKKHKVRKIIYDENGDEIKHSEKSLDIDTIKKFTKKCPIYKYTIYPTYDLSMVGFPEIDEILTAKSQLLNEY